MILASILITSDGRIPSPLPGLIGENIESLKRNHEDLEHTLFDNSMIRDFLSANFDSTVLAAYDDLVPYAYKADLARYCILYKLGGVYSDISLFIMSPFAPVDGKLGAFRDGVASPWDITNAVIASPPGHKALKKSIEMVCDNVKRRYYGPSPIAPTGPTLFGKAIALTCEAEDVNIGECFRPPHGGDSARCLVDTTADRLVAVSRKITAGSLEELGITNGNSYNELWHTGSVYRSEVKRDRWSASWLHGRRYTKGRLDGDALVIEGENSGAIIWGPYAHLSPGEYVASIQSDDRDAYGDFQMDIAAGKGKEILAQGPANSLTREPFRSTLSFSLSVETPAVEVRLHAGGPHKISVKEVQLEKRGA